MKVEIIFSKQLLMQTIKKNKLRLKLLGGELNLVVARFRNYFIPDKIDMWHLSIWM